MSGLTRARMLALVLLATGTVPRPAAGGDLAFRGLLDLVASGRGVALESNWFNFGDSNFDAYRLRLFAEGTVADRLEVYTQMLFTDAAPARALGAYVSYAPLPERDLHLLAGKIPWLIGTYGPRGYSDRNPLISAPLLYQYHTTLRADQLVPTTDALLARAGRGQYGVNYAASGGSTLRGLPIVYDLCWDFGVAATGSARPFEAAVSVVNGTPGRMNSAQDENDGKSILGRCGLMPIPAVRVGVSGSIGPYVHGKLDPVLPSGKRAGDYDQRILMADAEFLVGPAELRGEAYRNFWDTPTVGTLSVDGFYVEGKVTLPIGLYAAGRWEEMEFGAISDSLGARHPWDYDRTRLEAGLGYRLARGVLIKGVVQRFSYEQLENGETEDHPFHLYAAQLSAAF